ncbi:MAG: 3-phosphoserine/phosphohydroxythreonine transaminase [Phycisphaerales bacterium]|nr:3-phosphoserine/phosphohydroxythreonine transaminase [Phycisphaerales bacterium]
MPVASKKRIFNFSAGPAIIPEPVIEQAQHDLWNIQESGIGIVEHSHRGDHFQRVLTEADIDCRKLANISDDYAIVFLQGGATTQFSMIPMNFLPKDGTADYLDTGVWASKAIKDAQLFGNVNVAFDGSKSKYRKLPESGTLNLTEGAAYTHYCSNNTIYGTEFHATPTSNTPLIADMSSDIFSRQLDINSHAMIYAGAQKNLGPAGTVLVIMRKDLAERCEREIPSIFRYATHVDKESCFNTPPTFGIYLIGQILKWILREGGLLAIEHRNIAKAKVIYDVIDNSGGFYSGVSDESCRSNMNITFRTPNDKTDAMFLDDANKLQMSGLKGHRSAGGLRASIYNAFPKEGCDALAEFMQIFAKANG